MPVYTNLHFIVMILKSVPGLCLTSGNLPACFLLGRGAFSAVKPK